MEPLEKSKKNVPTYSMVEIRFLLPSHIAEWFTMKAQEVFKHRNTYIKDIMVAIYRRDNDR